MQIVIRYYTNLPRFGVLNPVEYANGFRGLAFLDSGQRIGEVVAARPVRYGDPDQDRIGADIPFPRSDDYIEMTIELDDDVDLQAARAAEIELRYDRPPATTKYSLRRGEIEP
jgi:hypothetical protein